MSDKKFVIFADLKDFTYKNALLTAKQIQEILSEFDRIAQKSAQKHEVTILKSIWDAYLILADTIESAYNFSIDLLELSEKYDRTQKLIIKKISLRVTITYWTITQNNSLKQEDYFWEAINIWARVMDITPAGHIFCTSEVFMCMENQSEIQKLWLFSFKGLLSEIDLYSVKAISDEEVKNLQNKKDIIFKQCDEIIFRASCVAAVLSLQPIPFIDSFHLIAVHLYMILHIGRKFRKDMHLSDASKIFRELITPLGLSYVAFQWSSSALKILLPWVGGYIFAPVSFAVSYALWKVYIAYFYYDASGEKMSREIIKELLAKQRDEGKRLAKTQKKKISETWKKYMKDILSIKKEKDYEKIHKDTVRMLQSK